MPWTPKSWFQLTGPERSMRMDDAIQAYARDPNLPIALGVFCEQAGILDYADEAAWRFRILPAIESLRRNGPTLQPGEMLFNPPTIQSNAQPARLDVLYGVATRTGGRRGGKQKKPKLEPAVLGGPRAYFND